MWGIVESHRQQWKNAAGLPLTDERFARPRRFDLAHYWAESTRRFEAELVRGEATLRVSPRGMNILKSFSPAVADAAQASASAADGEGWVAVRVPIESTEHAADQFLRLAADAQVLAPAALRHAMVDKLRRIAALYATS
jgi:predicted DNA-binding transcriptional regulator YafY